MGFKCQICGRSMSEFYKGDICSDACRQKKARMKRNAGKTAVRVNRDIAELIKACELGIVDWNTAVQAHNKIWERLQELNTAIDNLSTK